MQRGLSAKAAFEREACRPRPTAPA